MWVARNRDGELRIFEFPPKRYHEGPTLQYEKTGFNDAVYIDDGKDDIYSFWAIREFYENNTIIDRKAFGIKFFEAINETSWKEYEPEWTKAITWEDEPVEVVCYPKDIHYIKDPWNNDEHYRAGYLRAEEFLKERLFNTHL